MSYYPLNSIPDYYGIDSLLTEEHLLIRQSVRDWVESFVMPKIDEAAQNHTDIPNLMKELGKVGALGPYIPEEYGGSGLDQISYGIIMQELERGDSAVRSAASVQSSLVMFPINEYGSEEQKKKFLPQLASGDMIGAFGLTEPNHGSDPSSMETYFVDKGDHYLLNGAKMWITNAPLCDIAVVWAKNEEGKVQGLIVQRDFEGFTTPETHNKWSLRASKTGELVFDNVKVPKENVLPKVIGLKGPLSCLNSARYGISWGVIGSAIDCYCTAVQYSKERTQFGKPIAGFQLQQKKLAEFLTEITKAQLLCLQLGNLKNAHKATPAQISMAKRNNVKMAIDIARESRQILGGMGIMGEFPMMRHAANLESVITYEGTHDIHLLITGMDITGINAFG
ncbi:acyl-CoA dehydrogenase family protein [Chryseobacterium gotjawalense]|uniref:glutaryl-CoA dehydrogenase (ETF) n=1 Tax=Chryseobacterium gotjawalense TaxID=3042315 RepID=A0ABY8RED8_9FLAO|nr:acyl-CoA dehydrogenase family protein [Chryseobacterium sp. wdc7]WHF52191.1 acyl-CoA dehydrogenase family protein [Chryseobacterium sp. wdc7]